MMFNTFNKLQRISLTNCTSGSYIYRTQLGYKLCFYFVYHPPPKAKVGDNVLCASVCLSVPLAK